MPKHLTFRNRTLDPDTPKVMGIVNVTPDSFSDGGKFMAVDAALDHIGHMTEEGAVIIDIGGESTRPGADPVSALEEAERVLPIIEKAVSTFPDTLFSVDTTKYEVAKQALELGVHIINDVSGLQKEPRFAVLCNEYNAGYVLMHSQGDPRMMQKNPQYKDVIQDLDDFFIRQLQSLEKAGVRSVMVDPGIGFGKTLNHNLQIVARLQNFTKFGYPVLVGASRKSMIGQILHGRPVEDRLAGTLAVHYHCLVNGASILRVHDIKEAVDAIEIFNALRNI